MDTISERLADLSPDEKRALLAELLRKKDPHAETPRAIPFLTPAPGQRHLPFPLTDIQQAYWVGRTGDFELGNVATHVYLEVEGDTLDFERLNQAWQRVIDRHDMLRAIVLPDGQQQILEHVPPYQIERVDLSGQDPQVVAARLEAVRQRMSHQVLKADQWPLFEFRAHQFDGQRYRLHVSIDLLIADAKSLRLLFKELAQLYHHPDKPLPPLELSFRDYTLAEIALQDSEVYQTAQDYWWNRLPTLPPAPALPLTKNPADLRHHRFVRQSAHLSAASWHRLKARAAQAGLTPTSVLCAAYAEILAAWSTSPRFTLNATLFNPLPLHPQVNDIVGDFTSMMFLEAHVSADEPFEARAQRLQKQLWEAINHRYVSGVRILRELARLRGRGGAMMPVVFTSILEDLSEMDWLGELVYIVTQTPQVWLDHQVFERDGALYLSWDTVEELFPEGLPQAMFGAYCRLLQHLADDEEAWQATRRQLIPPEQLEQRAAVNATDAPMPDALLHTLFAEQARRQPSWPAVISSARTLTYEALFRRSNQVGRRLRQLGARPNTLVAVVMEKGWEQVVAVLSILQSGAAYLPIDPELPQERLWYMLEAGEIDLAVTQSRIGETLAWPSTVQWLSVDDEALDDLDDQPLEPVQSPDDLAYVIFTSGSTGLPKGVMVSHRSVVNMAIDTNRRFDVGPEDRALALTALHHDLSVYDLFGLLAAGGTIIVPEAAAWREPAHWAKLMVRENVTLWNSVPALMEMLVEHLESHVDKTPHTLRLAILGGDWIPVTLPTRLKALIEGVQVMSIGGPTETTVWNIMYPVETVDPAWKSIPYGRPTANNRYHVLNEMLEPCPVWVPGHLYCAGAGLATGYWRDEERTNARFIPHPRTGERLYRTGDLGRYLPDGNIEFLGREDLQVKISGFRIELGEIEAALVQHPAVHAAVVTAPGEPQGKRHLVAYFVAASGQTAAPDGLKDFLHKKLPCHMVPATFVPLDALPLTANGKVDRAALSEKAPLVSGSAHAPKAEPSAVTTQVARVVAEALKMDAIEPETDLPSLGVNSIDMVRIANQLEKAFGFRLKIEDFYSLPTVAELARHYQQHSAEKEQAPAGTLKQILASFTVLTDAGERKAFERRQVGLRRMVPETASIQLVPPAFDEALIKTYTDRRSHRVFSPELIPLEAFSLFLSCLRPISLEGKPKYRYPSAGGLYPLQTYLHVKAGRVEGLTPGIYYYHPVDHRLALITPDAELDHNIHVAHNRAIADEAAFSIFLICQLGAIAPMYGEHSMPLATLEAGYMGQLLMDEAPHHQLGLCPIGYLDFDPIRGLFALEDSHVPVHYFCGGLETTHRLAEATAAEPARLPEIAGDGSPTVHTDSPPAAETVTPQKTFPIAMHVSALNAEVALAPDIRVEDARVEPASEPSHIFLTGSTGFLGAFLLHELLQQTEATIYCLVRSANAEAGQQKIQNNLAAYALQDAGRSPRIIAIPGDLTKPYLGLSPQQFAMLAGQIDVIYHNGAWVNWVHTYPILKATNVAGTHEVLRLACHTKLKPLHLTSSTAVFPFNGRPFRETDSLDYDDVLYGGYAQTKWVAEKTAAIAQGRGLPVSVYRPTVVTGHSQTGFFNPDNYLERMIKGCIQLECAPALDTVIDMAPVDYVSKAIIHLSRREDAPGRAFHLIHPQPIHLRRLLDWIEALGYPLRRMPYDAWKRTLFKAQDFQDNALYSFGPFIAALKEQHSIMPQHDCRNTLDGLAGATIACPPLDDALLHTYFAQYIRSGFLNEKKGGP